MPSPPNGRPQVHLGPDLVWYDLRIAAYNTSRDWLTHIGSCTPLASPWCPTTWGLPKSRPNWNWGSRCRTIPCQCQYKLKWTGRHKTGTNVWTGFFSAPTVLSLVCSTNCGYGPSLRRGLSEKYQTVSMWSYLAAIEVFNLTYLDGQFVQTPPTFRFRGCRASALYCEGIKICEVSWLICYQSYFKDEGSQ